MLYHAGADLIPAYMPYANSTQDTPHGLQIRVLPMGGVTELYLSPVPVACTGSTLSHICSYDSCSTCLYISLRSVAYM